jgi:hypothetical protein
VRYDLAREFEGGIFCHAVHLCHHAEYHTFQPVRGAWAFLEQAISELLVMVGRYWSDGFCHVSFCLPGCRAAVGLLPFVLAAVDLCRVAVVWSRVVFSFWFLCGRGGGGGGGSSHHYGCIVLVISFGFPRARIPPQKIC